MSFNFTNEQESQDSNAQYITFYATGGKEVSIKLENCEDCQPSNFTDGEAITLAINQIKAPYILKVFAEDGDYISVGAKIINNDGTSKENTLSSETGQISGFLKKGLLEKECYTLPEDKDIYYITGTLYNYFAIVGLTDDTLEIKDTDINYSDGGFFSIIFDNSKMEKSHVCIQMSDISINEYDSFSYSIQLQSKSNYNGNNYSPQYPGIIYPRIIPTGELAYFVHLFPRIISNYTIYNMITQEGYPKMYVYECFTYPLCKLDYSNLEENKDVKRISDINRMSTYFIETKYTAYPIDRHQFILVVKCNEAKGDAKDNYNHCKFMTSIFGEKEEIVLIENQPFGQYMIKGDTDQYLIDISQVTQPIKKIHIDFYVVSGDVSFDLKDKDTDGQIPNLHKYYLANKIFYSLTMDDNNKNLKRIRIQTTAKINSYYIVEYKLLIDEEQEKTNTIFSSINYLVPI